MDELSLQLFAPINLNGPTLGAPAAATAILRVTSLGARRGIAGKFEADRFGWFTRLARRPRHTGGLRPFEETRGRRRGDLTSRYAAGSLVCGACARKRPARPKPLAAGCLGPHRG